MSAKLFTVNNSGASAEILITGPIGGSFWDDSGMTEAQFIEALKEVPDGKPLTVGINSEGGSVQDGLGIYNAIQRRGNVTTRNDGYALSIASIIMLAGEKRISPTASIWMIHDPWSVAAGNAEELRKAATMLDKHGSTLAKIISEKTGKDEKEIRDLMKAETWMDGAEAVSLGLATHQTDDPVTFAALNTKPFKAIPERVLNLAAAKTVTHTPTNKPVTAAAEPLPTTGEKAGIPPAVSNQTPTRMENTPTVTAAANPPVDNSAAILAALQGIQASLDKQNTVTASTGVPAQPLTVVGSAENLGDAHDKFVAMKPGAERRSQLVSAWSEINAAGVGKRDDRGQVFNTSTISATLTVAMLNDTVTTILQNRLAPLSAFCRDFSTNPMRPKGVVYFPKVTAAGGGQTNPTDWEVGTATADVVTLTPAELSVSWDLTSDQLQKGSQIDWFTRIKSYELANLIIDAAMTPITEANFGSAVLTSAAAAFSPVDLQTILAEGKNFFVKNLILDGAYTARLVPTNMEGFGWVNGGARQGFDGIYQNNRWSGAGTNIVGAMLDAQALIAIAGLPLTPPGAGSAFLSLGTATIPDINISVQAASWYKPGTRVQWNALDVIFAAAVNDTTAGKVIKSA